MEKSIILVVDDETMVLKITREMLETSGYDIIEAVDGQDALDKYAICHADLVILDMIMPGLGGKEVFFHLMSQDPQARVLVCSGYAKDGDIEKILQSGGKGFLQKPFSMKDICEKVKEALAS